MGVTFILNRIAFVFSGDEDKDQQACGVKETTLTFSFMYLSPLTSEVYLLVNLFSTVVCYLYSSVDCFHIW